MVRAFTPHVTALFAAAEEYRSPWTCAIIGPGGSTTTSTTTTTSTGTVVNPAPGQVFVTGTVGSGH